MALANGSPNHACLPKFADRGPDSEAARKVTLDRLVAEVSPIVFASLPRADQRRKGVMYLRGLLGAPGRKSVRNIAAFLGKQVNDQGLHHFINDSTWDWEPMREALGRYLARHTSPHACVLQPMIIPKSGTHSVGVARTFSWERGQAVTAQQVVGVWAVSATTASPVNWRLHLPPTRPRGRGERDPSGPETGYDTPEDSMVRAYLETAMRHRIPDCPVVLNAERLDGIGVVSKLSAAGVSHISKVAEDTWLLPADPALPGWGDEPLQASRIARLVKVGRKRMFLIPSGTDEAAELVATVRVRLPAVPDGTRRSRSGIGDFLLLGVGGIGGQWPAELWLTDLTNADHASLLRLIRLSRRVESLGMPRAEQVGIRDFAGRSFAGWHRHATLASVAHAVTELAEHKLSIA
ncbi:hypothetical protein B4N89_05230 [Embleya scabrispora]|uniref:Transposase IS701-like DDE domain-containing protein n=2 Tax=Embleya scabrispora TaxID=159449 RepID=A0A1T3NU63_9ACTN|nr:hypothetical protein B4N89_05230 [Embleya scabrispora]